MAESGTDAGGAAPGARAHNNGHDGRRELVGRWVVGLMGVAMLVAGALGAVRATRGALETRTTDNWAFERTEYDMFECARTQLNASIPAGSTVIIGDLSGASDKALWSQRLSEMTFPRAILVAPGARSDYVITMLAAPDGPSCNGARITVGRGS